MALIFEKIMKNQNYNILFRVNDKFRVKFKFILNR